MTVPFDLAVIGAGPAGATAAFVAARGGLRVALVDQAVFPRDKVCGDGIAPGAVGMLKDLGLGGVFDDRVAVQDIVVSGPRGRHLKASIAAVTGSETAGFVVPREEFDDYLYRAAIDAGATDLAGHTFRGLGPSTGGSREVLLERDHVASSVYARIVIGADGAYSRVRKSLGIPRNPPNANGVAIRGYVASHAFVGQTPLLLTLSETLRPAYAWLFSTGRCTANIGVGLQENTLRKRGIKLRSVLDTYYDHLQAMYGHSMSPLTDIRSHQLPHVRSVPRMAHDRVVLIGDAAALINPITGEGIGYALDSAIGLCRALLAADLSSDTATAEATQLWEAGFRRRYRGHFASSRLGQRLLMLPGWTDRLLKAADKDPVLLADAVDLLLGAGRIKASTPARVVWPQSR